MNKHLSKHPPQMPLNQRVKTAAEQNPTSTLELKAVEPFWQNRLFLALAMITLGCLAFWPSLQNGFIWDDARYLTENVLVKQQWGIFKIWSTLQMSVNYWPLTHSVFWLMYQFFQLDPFYYHAVNLLLHLLNGLLVWKFTQSLGLRSAPWIAILFICHPMQVETVAWVSQLKNVLSTLFCLLTLIAFLQFLREPLRRNYLWALIFFALSMLAKTSTVTLPGVLLLLTHWHHKKWGGKSVLHVLPFFILGFSFAVFFLWTESLVQSTNSFNIQLTMIEKFIIVGKSFWFYIGKFIWPAPLMTVYPYWTFVSNQVGEYLPFAGLLGLVVACIWAFMKGVSWPAYIFSSFFFMIFPILGFFYHMLMPYLFVADHYAYIAIISYCILVAEGSGYLMLKIQQKLNKIKSPSQQNTLYFKLILSFFIMTYILISQQQTKLYFDQITLWTDASRKNPQSFMIWHNLSLIETERGNLNKAHEHIEKVIKIKNDYAYGYFHRAAIFSLQQRYQAALEDIDKAIALMPNQELFFLNRAAAHERLGQPDQQMADFAQALKINPSFLEVYINRGYTHTLKNNYAAALADYGKALEINPHYAPAYNNRAIAYEALNQPQNAMADYLKALENDPGQADAHYNLARLYSQKKQETEALKHYDQAIHYNSKYQLAFHYRGTSHEVLGDFEQALKDYSRSLELDPNYAMSYNSRGTLYIKMNQFDAAIADLDRAILLQPRYNDAYNNRGYAYLMGHNDLKTACLDWRKACDLGNCANYQESLKSGDCK